MIHIKCSCGKYDALFDDSAEGIAEVAAEMHVLLGEDHRVVGKKTNASVIKQLFVIAGFNPNTEQPV